MRDEFTRRGLGFMILLPAAYLLQRAVFPPILPFTAVLLLPLIALAAGLLGGAAIGGCVGLAAGILCDCALSGQGLLFTVYLAAAGFFAGFLGSYVLAAGFPAFLLISAVGLLLGSGLQALRLYLENSALLLPLLRAVLLQSGVSMLFCLPVYLAVRGILRVPARRHADKERSRS